MSSRRLRCKPGFAPKTFTGLREVWYEPDETGYAAFEPTGDLPCTIKGVSLVGFEGSFVTNLLLPDGLALGRSVSHGSGWFRRISPG